MDSYTQKQQAGANADHQSASRMMAEPAAPPTDEAEWTVESISVRPAKNGGFIVSSSKTREATRQGAGNQPMPTMSAMPTRDYESNDYAFSDMNGVHRYLDEEFGVGAGPGAPETDDQEILA